MAKLMRMHFPQAGLFGPLLKPLIQPVVGHWTKVAEPQLGSPRVAMARSRPQITVERDRRLVAEGTRARPASLAEDMGHVMLEVDVLDLEPREFGASHSRVDEQPDERGVAPLLERRAGARLQQPHELRFSEYVRRLLRNR